MNERMNELAKQAGLESFYVEYSPWQIPFEHFAELIVRECAGLHTKNIMVGGGTDYNRGRRLLAEGILKHFGVEE